MDESTTAICKALNDAKQNQSQVLLVMVVTEEGGRIWGCHYLAVKQVLDSIELKHGTAKRNSYAVLVNKCDLMSKPLFYEKGKVILETSFSRESRIMKYPTVRVRFIPKIDELVCAENAKWDFMGLREWVIASPSMVDIVKVSKIDSSSMEVQLAKFKAEMAENNKRLLSAMKEELEKHQKEVQEHKEAAGKFDIERVMIEAVEPKLVGGLTDYFVEGPTDYVVVEGLSGHVSDRSTQKEKKKRTKKGTKKGKKETKK